MVAAIRQHVTVKPDGQKFPGLCRWGVSFTHVARVGDLVGDHLPTWSLMAKDAIEFWKGRFYGAPSRANGPITISTR